MGLSFSPPLVPPTTLSYLETPTLPELYKGKNILSIHGKEDTLVPFDQGREAIEAIQVAVNAADPADPADRVDGADRPRAEEAQAGRMQVEVVRGVGHVLVPEMVRMAADWVWRFALSERPVEPGVDEGEGRAMRESESKSRI